MPERPILLDLTRLSARHLEGLHPTGVDRVVLAYLRHYRSRTRALVRHGWRWLRLTKKASDKLIAALLGESSTSKRDIRWAVAHAHLFREDCHPNAWFFNLSHSGLEDPRYARILQRQGLRPVYFVHDLIPLTHPEYARPGEDVRHALRLDTIVRSGEAVIFNSRATQKSWQAHWRSHGRPCQLPELVAPLGCEPLPAPRAERPLSDPYFVVLGTIEARKNHLLLLQIWRSWIESAGADVPLPKLVLIGRRGWECEQVVDLLERSLLLQGQVLELGRCSDLDLATWLAHAQALLFPSFAEGFGLPLAEALSMRTPVIASDLAAFREAAGDIPEYLHPLDGMAWWSVLRDYATNGPRRQAQLRRLSTFQPGQWADHFALVDDFLESLRDSSSWTL